MTPSDLSRSLGWQVIAWIEHFLVHGPGDVQGQPIELDEEFAAFIVKAYRVNADGERVVRRAVLSRAKGRSKSGLAAMIACVEALGPVRFSHWAQAGEVSSWGYAYEEGEPVGRRVANPEVMCVATEEGQAGNTYDAIHYMLHPETCSDALADAFGKLDVGLTRINVPGGGFIEPASSGDSSKDGGKSTFVVFDETHLWHTPRLKRMHGIITRNLLKRKVASGWSMETTTMYAPGEDSIAESTHQYATGVREGRIKDAGLLFDHKQAAVKWELDKRPQRLKALAEAYGPASAWMNLDAIADSWDDPQVREADFRRYWLNQPVSLSGEWLPAGTWDTLHEARPIPDGAPVVLALDGSFNNDATGVVAVQIGDRPHLSVVCLFERTENDAPDWQVPIADVEAAIIAACQRWDVRELACDPFRWSRTMQALEVDHGLGERVVAFPQSPQRMTPATQRFYDLAVTGELSHDGDPRLARHIANAVLKSDSRGKRLNKEHRHSKRKIDLAVCAVMAVERAAHHNQQPVAVAPGFFAF